MIEKRIIDNKRQRKIDKHHPYSAIEQEYNRYRENHQLTPAADHMYLFFVSVSDKEGMSYYSGAKIQKYLGIGWDRFSASLEKLVTLGLIKYEKRENHLAVQILQVPDWEIAKHRFVKIEVKNVTVQTTMTQEQYNKIMFEFETQLANDPAPDMKDFIWKRMLSMKKEWDETQASFKRRNSLTAK